MFHGAAIGARRPGDIGRHAPRVHATDVDAGLSQFLLLAQRLRVASHREFGRIVGGLGRYADDAEHAGNVDQVTALRPVKKRQKHLAAVDHAPEVDAHQPLDVLYGVFLGGAAQSHAGVVDDDIHVAAAQGDRLGPAFHGGAIRYIDAFDMAVEILSGQAPPGRFQRIQVDIRQLQRAPGRVQRLCRRAADTGTGTGDHGNHAFEIAHCFHPPGSGRSYMSQSGR